MTEKMLFVGVVLLSYHGNFLRRYCCIFHFFSCRSINGDCFGGGLQIALGCDIRFTTKESRFSLMEGKDYNAKVGVTADLMSTLMLVIIIFEEEKSLPFMIMSNISVNRLSY